MDENILYNNVNSLLEIVKNSASGKVEYTDKHLRFIISTFLKETYNEGYSDALESVKRFCDKGE